MVTLWASGLPLSTIEAVDKERYIELKNNSYLLSKYTVFQNAIGLGLTFSPKDISMEDLNIFVVIKNKEEEVRKTTDGNKRAAII